VTKHRNSKGEPEVQGKNTTGGLVARVQFPTTCLQLLYMPKGKNTKARTTLSQSISYVAMAALRHYKSKISLLSGLYTGSKMKPKLIKSIYCEYPRSTTVKSTQTKR